MIDLGLTQPNPALNQPGLHPFHAHCPVNFVAVTSAQKSTETLESASSDHSEKQSEFERSEAISDALANTGEADKQDKKAKEGIDRASGQSENDVPEDHSEQSSVSTDTPVLSPLSETSMEDYYQLQTRLFGLTLAFTAFIFPFVWVFYSLQIALDYILGACAGVVYLRMLARNVSALGRDEKKNSSFGRLAVFAGVMIVALRWDQLDVIPVFLGFLTYKAAIIAFVLWTSFSPEKKKPTSG